MLLLLLLLFKLYCNKSLLFLAGWADAQNIKHCYTTHTYTNLCLTVRIYSTTISHTPPALYAIRCWRPHVHRLISMKCPFDAIYTYCNLVAWHSSESHSNIGPLHFIYYSYVKPPDINIYYSLGRNIWWYDLWPLDHNILSYKSNVARFSRSPIRQSAVMFSISAK